MITPDETMFIILGSFIASGICLIYACYLFDKRIRELEEKSE